MPQDVGVTTTITAVFTGLLAVIVFYAIRPREERRAVMGIAIAAFFVKAALVPLYYWLLVAEGLDGFAFVDAGRYDFYQREMAAEIANGRRHSSRGWRYNDVGFNVVGAYTYILFGANTLVVRMLNAMLSSFTLLYVYRIGVLAFDSKIARRAVLLTAFLPASLQITISHQKDPFVQFFATLLVFHGLRILLRHKRWVQSGIWLLAGLVPMYFLRHSFVLPFLGVLLASYFLARRGIIDRLAMGVLALMALATLQFAVGAESRLSLESSVGRLQGKFEASAAHSERGGLVRFARMNSIREIYKLPVLATLTVLLPFPPRLDLDYLPATLLSWSNAFFLVLLPQFLLGIFHCLKPEERQRRLLLLIVIVVFMTLIGSVNVSVSRYKETVFPIVLLLTASGMSVRQNMLWISAVYAGLGALAMLIYITWML